MTAGFLIYVCQNKGCGAEIIGDTTIFDLEAALLWPERACVATVIIHRCADNPETIGRAVLVGGRTID